MEVKYPNIKVHLSGKDGNAFAILSCVITALHNADVSKEDQNRLIAEATSGDYDHLLQVCMTWVEVE